MEPFFGRGCSSSTTIAVAAGPVFREGEFFIDKQLVQIHLIIEMILVDRPCAMGV